MKLIGLLYIPSYFGKLMIPPEMTLFYRGYATFVHVVSDYYSVQFGLNWVLPWEILYLIIY